MAKKGLTAWRGKSLWACPDLARKSGIARQTLIESARRYERRFKIRLPRAGNVQLVDTPFLAWHFRRKLHKLQKSRLLEAGPLFAMFSKVSADDWSDFFAAAAFLEGLRTAAGEFAEFSKAETEQLSKLAARLDLILDRLVRGLSAGANLDELFRRNVDILRPLLEVGRAILAGRGLAAQAQALAQMKAQIFGANSNANPSLLAPGAVCPGGADAPLKTTRRKRADKNILLSRKKGFTQK